MTEDFIRFFDSNYQALNGVALGRPEFNSHVYNEKTVEVPLNVLTRHGLVTGSTGTGKSRVIQLMIEELYRQGVPVFLSDIKGDMSGFCKEGVEEKIAQRADKLGHVTKVQSFPTRYWGTEKGLINFRIDLNKTDYIILAKLLELNSTQESHLGSIFKYARDNKLDISDLKTLNDVIIYLIKYPEREIGSSKSSLSVISRKINNLEYSNFHKFFGKPEFNLVDFLENKINILWLQNYQKERFNAGNIVSFFLSELYFNLPEVGNVEKPKLVIFIDEAHQIFDNANPKLVELMVSILKQIRSKGVGIIFNTQNADDIPEKILEQLGLKIQFALRSFSGKELQHIRGVVNSFPQSNFYNLAEEVKSLGIGTAFVSSLNEAGILLPPVKTQIFPPVSFMDAISLAEIIQANDVKLVESYMKQDIVKPLELGSPLDKITVSRGGNWQMNTFIQRKEEQKVNRIVNKKNRELRKNIYLILGVLIVIAIIILLLIILTLI